MVLPHHGDTVRTGNPDHSSPRRSADVAQLVAHHLAKVRVAGSNPVVRSEGSCPCGGVAERRGNGLQSRVHGFESRLHLARLAQRESASLTRKRSLVQSQYRAPNVYARRKPCSSSEEQGFRRSKAMTSRWPQERPRATAAGPGRQADRCRAPTDLEVLTGARFVDIAATADLRPGCLPVLGVHDVSGADGELLTAMPGTAPMPVRSSDKARHRFSRVGNRQHNAALHRAALTQARCHADARALLARRRAAGDGGWSRFARSNDTGPTRSTEPCAPTGSTIDQAWLGLAEERSTVPAKPAPSRSSAAESGLSSPAATNTPHAGSDVYSPRRVLSSARDVVDDFAISPDLKMSISSGRRGGGPLVFIRTEVTVGPNARNLHHHAITGHTEVGDVRLSRAAFWPGKGVRGGSTSDRQRAHGSGGGQYRCDLVLACSGQDILLIIRRCEPLPNEKPSSITSIRRQILRGHNTGSFNSSGRSAVSRDRTR